MKWFLKALSLIALLQLFASCRGDRAIQGFELTDPDNLGLVKSLTLDTLAMAVSFEDTVAATGEAGLLLLGVSDNLRSSLLIRWENLPLVENEVLEATIVLSAVRVLGATNLKRGFDVTVHEVTADWDEVSVTDASLGGGYSASPIGGGEVTNAVQVSIADSLQPERTRIPLTEEGVALVNQWRDTTAVEHKRGILIDFVSADFMKFFEARTGANRPRLEMVTRLNDTDRDTLLFAPTGDSYLIRKTGSLPAGPLYVDHVTSQQFVLKFAFDARTIPRESLINRALLGLQVDRERSVVTEEGFPLEIIRLAEEFQNPPQFSIDSTIAPLTLNINESATGLAIPIGELFQDWVSTAAENHGILIRTATPGRDVSRLAFFSAQTDASQAPLIDLEISVAPPGEGQQ